MEDIIRIKHLEIVHLDLSYRHIRVQNPRAVMRMADSMQRYGQIMPVLVVAAKPPRHTLIDGYLRVAAARRLRQDTLLAHIWHEDEKHALCHILVKDDQRRWDIFEQAGLVKELHSRHQLSQRLADSLMKHPLSTRQLFIFFKHYQRSNRKVRENMVNEPLLFVKAMVTKRSIATAKNLPRGRRDNGQSSLASSVI
jgi:hypothetical protein